MTKCKYNCYHLINIFLKRLLKLRFINRKHLQNVLQVTLYEDISRSSEHYYRGSVNLLLNKIIKDTNNFTGQFVIIVEGKKQPLDFKQKEREIQIEKNLLNKEYKLLEKVDLLKKERCSLFRKTKQISVDISSF